MLSTKLKSDIGDDVGRRLISGKYSGSMCADQADMHILVYICVGSRVILQKEPCAVHNVEARSGTFGHLVRVQSRLQ